jgi:outer membrane receptor protein involved in Fe transport
MPQNVAGERLVTPFRFAVFLITFTLLFAVAICGSAQTTATLTGMVTLEHAPAAGARVTVTSPSMQGSRSTITGASGVYDFNALTPGRYSVRVELAGAEPGTAAIDVQLAETARGDITLARQFRESITVQGSDVPAITSPAIATNFTLREIDRLPVQRNQLATAQLAPGVTANVLANGELQVSGGPGYDNLALVNGVVVNENSRGQLRPLYVEDAIQETTILTGAIPAEYGRFTGGVIDTITKSGGNSFSGSLRDSLGNPAWSAATPAGEARAHNLNQVWEATFGGYLLRDRLWFFTAGRSAKNETARQTFSVPAFNGTASSPASPALSYNEINDQQRIEEKLTALLHPGQSLVASFFTIATKTNNSRTGNIYDTASFARHDDPDSLLAAHYTATVTNAAVVELQYAKRKLAVNFGSEVTDLVGGTVVLDRANGNTRANSPSLCAACGTEHRDNSSYLGKANWFFDGRRFGAHTFTAGAERFEEQHVPNSHQSGSDFSVFSTRVQWKDGVLYPVFTPTTATGGNTFIRWTPISGDSSANHLVTDSLFLSDRWTLGTHWSFGLGARYDRNDATDADGNVASNDRKLSPRLSAQYDVAGNGGLRVNASFSEYVSHVTDAIASATQTSGNAAMIDFAYKGPAINATALNTPMAQALEMLFAYFNAQQGGTANTSAANLRASGTRVVPGYSAYFDGSLRSPSVREVTLGASLRLGSNAYVRADLIRRDGRDFYAASVTTSTQHVTTPFGIATDLALERNTNALSREYRALQLQSRWSVHQFSMGVDYTYAKMRGNDDGENANGPVANADPSLYYREFLDYARFAPVGWLQGDQRHRARVWAAYDLGRLTLSLLQTFDSGMPYSAAAAINTTRYDGAPANPGYASIPNGQYYFSERGQFRTDDISSTNLGIRFTQPLFHVELFAQGDLLNAFNRAGIADASRVGTTVATAATSSTFVPFNPFTQTPVACAPTASAEACRAIGANYQLATNFGQALNEQAYQTPRTVRVSVGVRF